MAWRMSRFVCCWAWLVGRKVMLSGACRAPVGHTAQPRTGIAAPGGTNEGPPGSVRGSPVWYNGPCPVHGITGGGNSGCTNGSLESGRHGVTGLLLAVSACMLYYIY